MPKFYVIPFVIDVDWRMSMDSMFSAQKKKKRECEPKMRENDQKDILSWWREREKESEIHK